MAKNVGKIVGINGNMVSVETDSQVSLNEVGYILVGEQKLKAEVIRITGKRLELQVFEATAGIGIGNIVELTGDLLTVELGPGLLTQIYDGLQNPLPELAEQCGFFLQRGIYLNALPRNTEWDFTPSVKTGDTFTVGAGNSITNFTEGNNGQKITLIATASRILMNNSSIKLSGSSCSPVGIWPTVRSFASRPSTPLWPLAGWPGARRGPV